MIQYIKLLIISWFVKGKIVWKRIWNSLFTKNITEEETSFVSHEKYDSMFSSKETNEDILVSERVWDKIQHTISDKAVFPNPKSVGLIKSMESDTLDSLFQKPDSTSKVYVDLTIWNNIEKNLPSNYLLPAPLFERVTKPMSSEYYDSLFSRSLGAKKVFVDNQVWEPIMKNLPDAYTIPAPNVEILKRPSQGNGHIPILIKQQSKR
ncbi:hypothetical protein [Bacillus sp. FJAT-22090]|uniref:hypothetical protein n=1 Tax=Bacillus sp. FJAT-22090 TaxID=1581038 RepID=UPI0011AAAF26|nr:hypothetical protein [Bacillus sp. FJAT-22090]